jgi:hypothetical protein
MQVAGAKPVDDAVAFLVERGALAADRPITGQSPLVESRRFGCIEVALVSSDSLIGACTNTMHRK